MSDARLRELERKAAAGDPEAEVALLRERVRVGALTRDAIALAAFSGHRPSREYLGPPQCQPGHTTGRHPDDLSFASWAGKIANWLSDDPWRRRGAVTALIALAEAIVVGNVKGVPRSVRERDGKPAADPRVRRAIDAARAWLVSQTSETATDAAEAGSRVQDLSWAIAPCMAAWATTDCELRGGGVHPLLTQSNLQVSDAVRSGFYGAGGSIGRSRTREVVSQALIEYALRGVKP